MSVALRVFNFAPECLDGGAIPASKHARQSWKLNTANLNGKNDKRFEADLSAFPAHDPSNQRGAS